MSDNDIRRFRWSDCAMVFQGRKMPLIRCCVFASNSPIRRRARANRQSGSKAHARPVLSSSVSTRSAYESYPHELSGGCANATLLALGVMLDPQVVILDEPTTALDILTQRAIIDVLQEMQKRLHFSIIFISHDLALAAEMADRVATMYAGEIVEEGAVDDIFYRPAPYTLGLIRSLPKLNREQMN
jgi:peptide/nickel transport system ATP-binding protein